MNNILSKAYLKTLNNKIIKYENTFNSRFLFLFRREKKTNIVKTFVSRVLTVLFVLSELFIYFYLFFFCQMFRLRNFQTNILYVYHNRKINCPFFDAVSSGASNPYRMLQHFIDYIFLLEKKNLRIFSSFFFFFLLVSSIYVRESKENLCLRKFLSDGKKYFILKKSVTFRQDDSKSLEDVILLGIQARNFTEL